jgi:hypothetical protein
MMPLYTVSLTALCLLFLSGCETVSSLQPVGITAVKTPADKWQGSWVLDDEGVIHTKVINEEKGELLLIVVNLERQFKNELLEFHNVTVRKTGSNYYFNLIDNEKDKTYYYFAKFIRNGNTINVYLPSFEHYSKAVASGKIKNSAREDSSTIILQGSASDINDFVESNPQGFSEKDTLVFRKVGK